VEASTEAGPFLRQPPGTAEFRVLFDDEVGLPAEASAQAGVGQNGF
jgi:hypothetical protein